MFNRKPNPIKQLAEDVFFHRAKADVSIHLMDGTVITKELVGKGWAVYTFNDYEIFTAEGQLEENFKALYKRIAASGYRHGDVVFMPHTVFKVEIGEITKYRSTEDCVWK